jgi:hypothetical protein
MKNFLFQSMIKEIKIYIKIISALKQPIETQKEIDKLYPQIGANLIKF